MLLKDTSESSLLTLDTLSFYFFLDTDIAFRITSITKVLNHWFRFLVHYNGMHQWMQISTVVLTNVFKPMSAGSGPKFKELVILQTSTSQNYIEIWMVRLIGSQIWLPDGIYCWSINSPYTLQGTDHLLDHHIFQHCNHILVHYGTTANFFFWTFDLAVMLSKLLDLLKMVFQLLLMAI